MRMYACLLRGGAGGSKIGVDGNALFTFMSSLFCLFTLPPDIFCTLYIFLPSSNLFLAFPYCKFFFMAPQLPHDPFPNTFKNLSLFPLKTQRGIPFRARTNFSAAVCFECCIPPFFFNFAA